MDIVLKIQNNNYEARSEIRILNWLNGKELVPKVICSHIEDGKSYLLMSKIKGKMSCEREFLRERVINKGIGRRFKNALGNRYIRLPL